MQIPPKENNAARQAVHIAQNWWDVRTARRDEEPRSSASREKYLSAKQLTFVISYTDDY